MKKILSKKLLAVLMIIAAAIILTACNSAVPAPTATPVPVTAAPAAELTAAQTTAPTAAPTAGPTAEPAAEQKIFTVEELAKFDGLNGNPAYIAFEGIVYDVTNVAQWKNGSHAGGKLKAGVDQTSALSSSPHTADFIKKLPPVGIYIMNPGSN